MGLDAFVSRVLFVSPFCLRQNAICSIHTSLEHGFSGVLAGSHSQGKNGKSTTPTS